MANVVEAMTAIGVDSDPTSGFWFRIFPEGDDFYAIRNEGTDPGIPLFDPPLIEWADGCERLQAVIRVPVGMCLTVSGKLKTAGQYPETSQCEPDLVVPSCENAIEYLSRSRPAGLEPDHTETLEVRAFAYSAEQCSPDSAPSWSARLYQGACPTPDP